MNRFGLEWKTAVMILGKKIILKKQLAAAVRRFPQIIRGMYEETFFCKTEQKMSAGS
jgi:hypothetical protein